MLKLKSIVLLGLVALLFSCTNSSDGFVVKGQFDNADGKMVYLNRIQNTLVPVDSVLIEEGGKFSLEGTFPTMELYLLQVGEEPNAVIYLALDNQSEVTLSGDAASLLESYTVQDKQGDNVLMAEISKHNYKAQMKFQEINNIYIQNQSTVANPDSLVKSCTDMVQTLMEEEKRFVKNIIDENKGSMATVWALYQQLGRDMLIHPDSDFEYWEKVAEGLKEKYPESFNTKEINSVVEQITSQKKAQENVKKGSEAPDFELTKPDGTTMKLSDLRGQYVLLDFWASWCRPCRAENPNVVKAYEQFKNKNFTIYQVSLDKNKQDWLDAIKKDGLSDWYHASDLQYWQSAPAKLYSVRGIPTNFLINPEGIIIAVNLRGGELSAKLREIFK